MADWKLKMRLEITVEIGNETKSTLRAKLQWKTRRWKFIHNKMCATLCRTLEVH